MRCLSSVVLFLFLRVAQANSGGHDRQLIVTDASDQPVVVDTNVPVLTWNTTVGTGVFAIRVNVSSGSVWWSREVFQQGHPDWRGLMVYEGPELGPGKRVLWTAEERVLATAAGDVPWPPSRQAFSVVARGEFKTSPSLPTAKDEAAAEMRSTNVTRLWQGSLSSVSTRITSSGFLPTSVSGGYGGITNEFVRDASGQLIGLLQAGKQLYPLVRRALSFMLGSLADALRTRNLSYAPHIMMAAKNLSKIINFDSIDQTDDTFYLVTVWGRYLELTGDETLAKDFYPLLATYASHYCGSGSSSAGGVPYWNASLSLLWNPNLEHSRLGSYWCAYDALTNTFAAEGLRHLQRVAVQQGFTRDAALWGQSRARILAGINTSLSFRDDTLTNGMEVFAELYGRPNYFHTQESQVGYSPLLWGLSFVNVVPALLGLSAMDAGIPPNASTMAKLGLDVGKMDATWQAIRRVGSFQWVTADLSRSAFVPATHVNSSGWAEPPLLNFSSGGVDTVGWCDYTAQSCSSYRGKTCACPSYAVIGKALGWELGWAAWRRDWSRLIVLHRWLGAAAHVEETTLLGESYIYDCIKSGERNGFSPHISNSTPRGANCWGDPGNGVQIGWFLWGEALARDVAGVIPASTETGSVYV